jgi:hypothetical protein
MTVFDLLILVTNPMIDIMFTFSTMVWFTMNDLDKGGSAWALLELALFSDMYYLFSLY